MERFQILRSYDICGQKKVCLCNDAGAPIVYNESRAKAQVAQLHSMGYADAYYEPLPAGEAWFDDENWIG